MSNIQYKNVSYDELISYAQNNPNRSRKLESIEVIPIKIVHDNTLDSIGLTGYQSYNLNPSGILSLFACIENPEEYTISTNAIKLLQISTLATSLQETVNNMKNTSLSRKRKKLHDLIGAAYNNSNIDDKDYYTLFNALSIITDNQFILMKSAVQESSETGEEINTGHKGEIIFSSDPRNWSYNKPTWIADYRARWVAIPTENNALSVSKITGSWLSFSEQSGWFIEWPEADGTKEEIISQLSQYTTWSINDKSCKKELLATRLGKAQTIKLFSDWAMKIDSSDDLESGV
jgi:hypothetical protein